MLLIFSIFFSFSVLWFIERGFQVFPPVILVESEQPTNKKVNILVFMLESRNRQKKIIRKHFKIFKIDLVKKF